MKHVDPVQWIPLAIAAFGDNPIATLSLIVAILALSIVLTRKD